MSKFTIKSILIITVLALASVSLSAQETETKSSSEDGFKGHIYVTADLGLDVLTGDVNKIKPGFDYGIGVGWQLLHWLSVKGNFNSGLLRGECTKADGFKIKEGNYIDANLSVNISLIDFFAGYSPNRFISVTPHIGMGTFQYRLKTDNADGTRTNVGIKENLNNDADYVYYGHGYRERRSVLEVPIGLELGFKIAPRWDLYLDYTATWTNSDLLDAHEIGGGNDWISAFNVGTRHRILRSPDQKVEKYCSGWFVSLEAGPFYALGDVRKIPLMDDTKFNINVGGGYKWGRCWKFYGKFGFATYTQDVRNNQTNEVVYVCNEGNQLNTDINVSFDIINGIKYKQDRLVSLYIHAGVGMLHYKSKGTYKKHLNGLPYYSGEEVYYGYNEYEDDLYHRSGNGIAGRRVVAEVPVGLELSFRLNEHWDVYGDATVAFCDGDLVNGIVSGTWEDWYFTTNVGARYNFSRHCPEPPVEEEKPTPQIIEPEEPEEPVQSGIRTVTRNDEVVLRFHWNETTLDVPENRKIIADFLERVGKRTITKIKIIAYASPEGSEKLNDNLSLRRAYAAKQFIENELKGNVKNAKFEMEGGGADWAGFMELLENSNIKNKEAIADMLNKANPATRYITLKKLAIKQPEIKDLYLTLRRASIKVKISTVEIIEE